MREIQRIMEGLMFSGLRLEELMTLSWEADADISAEVASGTNQPPSVILSFWPPGSGYPVRYWRLEIAFRRLDRLTFPFAVSAAMY